MNHKSTSHVGRRRCGGAMLELAVCLPVLSLIIFASLEGANLLFVRQAAVQAAYESAKAVVRPRSNLERARALGTQVLAARNITQHDITFLPAAADTAPRGTPIVVTVAVNSNTRGITGIGPFQNLQITSQAIMVKE